MNKAQKDKEFFEVIYNTTFTGLRKFVSYKCINSALIDDILQEVYIEVFRHIDQLREHALYGRKCAKNFFEIRKV